MTISANFPALKPSLLLDFANVERLDPRITFTRASNATYFDANGVLQTASSGVARFDHSPTTLESLGLLIEEQRTNSIRNNTMQGAVVGTPGSSPTYWSISVTNPELSTQVVAIGVESGISYIDIKLSGTVTAARSMDIAFESLATFIAASSGQIWTESVYLKQVAGSQTNISGIFLQANTYTSGGAYVTTPWFSSQTVTTDSLITQRKTAGATLVGATTAFIAPFLKVQTASSGAIDITLRIGLPQLELGAVATSVIPTTTAAATRNADVPSMTGTNFSSWYNATEGTFYADFNASPAGASGLWRVFSLNSSNRPQMFNNTTVYNFDASANSSSTGPAPTANAVTKFAGAYKNNDLIGYWNGTAGSADTSVTLETVTAMTIGGANGVANRELNNCIKRLAYYPVRLSNDQLQALTR